MQLLENLECMIFTGSAYDTNVFRTRECINYAVTCALCLFKHLNVLSSLHSSVFDVQLTKN